MNRPARSTRVGRAAPAAVLAAVLAAIVAAGPAAAAEPRTITAPELSARIESASAPLVLDVRTREEFAAGHIPGAVNIPVQELAARLGELAGLQTTEVVMHCETGIRATYADQILREEGFAAVRQLDGHMRGWRERGMPVTPAGCVTC